MMLWSPLVPHETDPTTPELQAWLARLGQHAPEPTLAHHPTGDIAAILREAHRVGGGPPADLADSAMPGAVWDTLLRFVPTTGTTSGYVFHTSAVLDWLGKPTTRLTGAAATPDRLMAGAAMLADHLGTGWPDEVPRALSQWILVAGAGVRRDHASLGVSSSQAQWSALSADQLQAITQHLLNQIARAPAEGINPLQTLLGNVPRQTPGLEALWATWIRTGDFPPSAVGDAPLMREWHRATGGRAKFLGPGLAMRPDWRLEQLDQWLERVGVEEFERLVPQDQYHSARIAPRIRYAVARGTATPEWPLWDHLATRQGALWPDSIPLVLEVLERLGPTLRTWGATWPRPLLTWLDAPALRAQLPRAIQRELLLHAHPDVRRAMATHLALREPSSSRHEVESPRNGLRR